MYILLLLLFILVFIFIILMLGFSVISSVIRTIFGIRHNPFQQKKRDNFRYTYQKSNRSMNDNDGEDISSRRQQKKIFSKDEGEYVDFEEIKE